jgi:hypothetical protein
MLGYPHPEIFFGSKVNNIHLTILLTFEEICGSKREGWTELRAASELVTREE